MRCKHRLRAIAGNHSFDYAVPIKFQSEACPVCDNFMSLTFTPHRTRRITRTILLAFLAFIFGLTCQSLADAQNDAPRSEIEIGFRGNVKLGKWTPIFIQADPKLTAVRFETQVLDGDDTPVVYTGPLLKDPDRPGHFQAWTRIGRTYGDVILRLYDAAGNEVSEHDLEMHGENRIADYCQSTRELILTLEPEVKFKNAIESVSSVANLETTRIVTSVGADDDLPINWLGYDAVESVLLVTSDLDRIEKLTNSQLDALEAWVKQGGKLILSVAKNGERLLSSGGKLARFCPGQYAGLGQCNNVSRLETYCDSRDQLIAAQDDPLAITLLNETDGMVLIDDGPKNGNTLLINTAMGLGQIVFVSFDLDSKQIMDWKGFTSLVSRLVSGSDRGKEEQTVPRSSRGSSVSHFGYEDLIGQLRVPLDRFSKVKFVKFALIAALIGLYILCIGPGDYFFLRKLLGKMELTWITFPLISLLFCGLAIGISRMTRPNVIQLNQLEIIDIDTIEGRVRGSVWTNLYSPSGRNCTVEIDSNHQLGFKIDSNLVSWHGLPGDGLGGMMTTANPGLLKTSYEQSFDVAANGQDVTTKIIDLPLQVSSTKPIFSHWWSETPVKIRSRLSHNARFQQLRGTITNQFDFTLKNCRVVFENWAYILEEPFRPGDTFDIQTGTDEKTLKSILTRKVKQEKTDRSDNSPWNPTDTRVNRIADIMMFYKAAGGNNYTGLTHKYQPFVDMTDHLDLRRAILVGEVDAPGAVLKINGENVVDQYDQVTTIVRIVFPVEYLKNRTSR